MRKIFMLIVVVAGTAGAVLFVRKRGGKDDADLWTEATQAADLR